MAFCDLALIFFTSLGLSIICVPFLLRFAHFKKLYDLPDYTQQNGRRIHFIPTPRVGGVAIVSSVFLTFYFWQIPVPSNAIFIASFILFLIGLIDDFKDISAKLRLVVQVCVACYFVSSTNLELKWIVINENFLITLPYVIGFSFAIFIIIGAINAINMSDGLDGLASGVTLIGISILSYFLFLETRKDPLLFLTFPILGSIIGFLKYNTYPSKIFMGDSGSNWLGFMIGAIILFVANSNQTIPLMSILLAFSIPIFDTAHVIIMRLIAGKNPMAADSRHFHHTLIKLGFTHSQAVGVIYVCTFFFGMIGMLPVAFPNLKIWWLSWCAILILIVLLTFSIQLKRMPSSSWFKVNVKIFTVIMNKIKHQLYLGFSFIESLHRYLIYLFLLSISFAAICTLKLISIIFACVCIGMCMHLFVKKNYSFLSAGILVVVSSIVYAVSDMDHLTISLFSNEFKMRTLYNFLFLFLFFITVILFSTKLKRKYFIVTPSDILLVLIPLLLLMMPDTWKHEYGLRIFIVRGVVLFGALRVFGKQIKGNDYSNAANALSNFSGAIPRPHLKPNP